MTRLTLALFLTACSCAAALLTDVTVYYAQPGGTPVGSTLYTVGGDAVPNTYFVPGIDFDAAVTNPGDSASTSISFPVVAPDLHARHDSMAATSVGV